MNAKEVYEFTMSRELADESRRIAEQMVLFKLWLQLYLSWDAGWCDG